MAKEGEVRERWNRDAVTLGRDGSYIIQVEPHTVSPSLLKPSQSLLDAMHNLMSDVQ